MRRIFKAVDPASLRVLAQAVKYVQFSLGNVMYDSADGTVAISFWNTSRSAPGEHKYGASASTHLVLWQKLWQLRIFGAGGLEIIDPSETQEHQLLNLWWDASSEVLSIEAVPLIDIEIPVRFLEVVAEVDDAAEREETVRLKRHSVVPLGEQALRAPLS